MEIADLGKKEWSRGAGIPTPRGTTGGGNEDQSGGVVAEKGAGGTGFGKNPAEIGVAGAVTDIEEDRTGERRSAIRCGGDFRPKNGMNAGLPRREEEINRGVKVGIRHPNCREAQFGSPGEDDSDR